MKLQHYYELKIPTSAYTSVFEIDGKRVNCHKMLSTCKQHGVAFTVNSQWTYEV